MLKKPYKKHDQKDKIADMETNKLVKITENLSPINLPKKPETIEAINGKKRIKYSILSF